MLVFKFFKMYVEKFALWALHLQGRRVSAHMYKLSKKILVHNTRQYKDCVHDA